MTVPVGSAPDGFDDVRRVVMESAAAAGIALAPVPSGGQESCAGWTLAGVPLGPFPARLRIDVGTGALWHDVVAAEVVPPVAVEHAIAEIDLPRPEVRLMVASTSWMVALSYPLALTQVTPSEVLGLLGAGALYAAALTAQLTGHHGKRWSQDLAGHGFTREAGFGHDPRDLLRGNRVAPWPRGEN
jgi:hypothetical protein